jgi:hypothetical protein
MSIVKLEHQKLFDKQKRAEALSESYMLERRAYTASSGPEIAADLVNASREAKHSKHRLRAKILLFKAVRAARNEAEETRVSKGANVEEYEKMARENGRSYLSRIGYMTSSEIIANQFKTVGGFAENFGFGMRRLARRSFNTAAEFYKEAVYETLGAMPGRQTESNLRKALRQMDNAVENAKIAKNTKLLAELSAGRSYLKGVTDGKGLENANA